MIQAIRRFGIGEISYWGFILVLFGLSGYFSYEVSAFRSRLTQGGEVLPQTRGSLQAVQGTVLSVDVDGNVHEIRLLGITTLEPWRSEPELAAYPERATRFLEAFIGQDVSLEFETLQKDDAGRILAHVIHEGRDLGLELVKAGLELVATGKPFPRMGRYLRSEEAAYKDKRGLWENPDARRHAIAMKTQWER